MPTKDGDGGDENSDTRMSAGLFTRRRVRVAIAFLLLGGAAVVGRQWWLAYQYPFGWSHSCDKGLFILLLEYADAHDGAFPLGGTTPEASLSLVAAGKDPSYFDLLRGKSIPAAVVIEQLRVAGELTPETCGWHYVEGLTTDDGDAALFWDKDGLGHNGQRLQGGGHVVTFANGSQVHVSAQQWQQFLADQAKLRAAAIARPMVSDDSSSVLTGATSLQSP